MKQSVLIDTCGWIDFLRESDGMLGDCVEQLIRADSAFMCSVTVAELLQGAKGKKEKQQLAMLFATIPCLNVETSDWHSAGECLQSLRASGVTLPLTDALIAAVAVRNDLPVLTVDKHFQHLSAKLQPCHS